MPCSWDGSWDAAGGNDSGDAEGAGVGNAGDGSLGVDRRGNTSSFRQLGHIRENMDCTIVPSFEQSLDSEARIAPQPA